MKINNFITAILFLLFVILFLRYLYKQKEIKRVSNNDKVTNIIISRDTILNLGAMTARMKKPFSYTIKNIGPNTLYISGLTASCGCTKIRANKKSASMGDSINVTGIVDGIGKYGKNIILTNFKANTKFKEHQVKIYYEVKNN